MNRVIGKVYLVGAGPGDPGLMTVRGLECLRQARVVIYDNLCNPSLLRYAPQDSEIVFAGKHSGLKTLTQNRIERLMIHRAQLGKIVVRLKGGDPFVFGRGAEEAAALRKNKIPFEVVPGITSAIAVPAYAGIPATHRDYSSGVAIVTAYEDPKKRESILDYQTLAKFPGTLIFLMGVKRLKEVVEKLVNHGKSSQTPVALIRWGTRGMQQTLVGKLKDIAQKSEQIDFRPPAVIVVGEVVRCRKDLQWFEQKPLFGRRIVVTRAREQAGEWAGRLRELGAEVIELPCIEIERANSVQLQHVIKKIRAWDWIFFTSPWAVEFFLDAVIAEHGDIRVLVKSKLAVIGPTTAAKLKTYGLSDALQPRVHTSMGLASEIHRWNSLRNYSWKGQKVLLPRSEIGREETEKELRKLGAETYPVTVYRNKKPKWRWEIEALQRVGADTVIFTSSSIVENFGILLKDPKQIPPATRKLLKNCKFISVGPMTSAAMKKMKFHVHAEAKTATLENLIQAMI